MGRDKPPTDCNDIDGLRALRRIGWSDDRIKQFAGRIARMSDRTYARRLQQLRAADAPFPRLSPPFPHRSISCSYNCRSRG